MKKILLLGLALISLTGCQTENVKYAGGNQMVTGSRTFNYAFVRSNFLGDRYYHISGWREYGPEGNGLTSYVGLELQLAVSKEIIYYYEPGLMYVMMKEYNSSYGKVIE